MKQGWITYFDGSKTHYVDGHIHNDNEPAIIYADGAKSWFERSKHHIEDGPAIEYGDGSKEWFYKGKNINVQTNEEFLSWVQFKAFL